MVHSERNAMRSLLFFVPSSLFSVSFFSSSLFSSYPFSPPFFLPHFLRPLSSLSCLVPPSLSFLPHNIRISNIPILYRHLKLMYFTVLERFSREELLSQIAALSGLEAELLSDTKAKSRRRTLRNQKDRIHARLKELDLEIPDREGGSECVKREDDVCDVLQCGLIDRKGLDVAQLISPSTSPSSSSSSVIKTQSTHSNTTSSSLHHHEGVRDDISSVSVTDSQPSLRDQQSSSPLDTAPATQLNLMECKESDRIKEEENAVNTQHEKTLDPLIPHKENLDSHFPNLISVSSESSIPLNPKTRLGWGFWQT